MRFDEEMDRRLQNWARWRAFREDGGRVATCSFGERVDGDGWDAQQVIPTSDAEAEETQHGVARMDTNVRRAVEAWYLGGGGVAQRCRRADCSETTLRERVAHGQRQLGQWLADKREAARRERQRVELLQRCSARGR